MSDPKPLRLEVAIRSGLVPALRYDGFAGSGRTFRRVIKGWVHVVNVQASRYGGAFAINLAIHPLAIPDLSCAEPNPKKITEQLCEFRRRLSETQADQWWKYDATADSMDAAVAAATVVYARQGRSLFARVSGDHSPMMTVTAAQLRDRSFDFAGFGSTDVRMALALARLRRSEGRIDESRAFAAYGLEKVGRTTLLGSELAELALQ